MVRPFSRRQQSTQVLLVRNVVWAHNQDIAEVDKYERQASQDTDVGNWVLVGAAYEKRGWGSYNSGVGNVIKEHINLEVPLDEMAEKTWESVLLLVKSQMLGTGYLSET